MHAAELFELLAATTWRTILRANRNRIAYGEDAITSVNLNAIASSSPRCIVLEDTRVDETRKGCDFELWIGTDHKGWRRYAVQAKKITVKTWRYDKLNHLVRGRPQLDILNDYASRVRAAPIYCLYTFAPHVLSWNCSLPQQEAQLGCMVTPSAVVQDALRIRGARNFTFLHMSPDTLPWRCLIRCDGSQHQRMQQHTHARVLANESRWPDPKGYHHDDLPQELQALRRRGSNEELFEGDRPRFEDQSLRPKWTVVVDTTDEPRE